MNIKKIEEGVIFKSKKGTPFQSNTFPYIEHYPSGEWICTFRSASSKKNLEGEKVVITRSLDSGKSWSNPIDPFPNVPDHSGKKGSFRMMAISYIKNKTYAVLCWVDQSNPALTFFNTKTEGLLDCKLFVTSSHDNGYHWEQPHIIQTGYDIPTPPTGPILKLNNEELVCSFELNKPYEDLSPWVHSSVISFSADGGQNWKNPIVITNDPSRQYFYWDQRLQVLEDGSLLNFFWSYDNVKSKYIPIHYCKSNDHGRTWSDLKSTNIPGQPANVVSFKDGTLVLVYVDREVRPSIKAKMSFDHGFSWDQAPDLTLYELESNTQTKNKISMQDAWNEMEQFSLGLPYTVKISEKEFLVVFYAGHNQDETDIRWAKVSRS